MRRPPFVGTWKLVSCEHTLADGTVLRPYGARPLGRLVYTKEGRMIVVIMASGRPRFASGGLYEGADAEWAAAARTFIAYSGRWEFRGGRRGGEIVHHVDISLFPNWTGSRQLRRIDIRPDRLTFATNPFSVRGVRQTARLVWRRAG